MAGAIVYNALFLLLSVLTTRAIAVGLLYLLVWEGLLGTLVPGVRLLSAGQYALSVANSIAHATALNAHLALATAAPMALAVTVLALALAARRLSRFSIKGDVA